MMMARIVLIAWALAAWFLPWISAGAGLFSTSESPYSFAVHYVLWLNPILLLLALFLKRFQLLLTVGALANVGIFVWRFQSNMSAAKRLWSFEYGFYLHLAALLLLLALSMFLWIKNK